MCLKRVFLVIGSPLALRLVDGHWIMARTGTVEGRRLGRLKQWLHRIQIEEEITDQNGMETALSRLPFEHGSPDEWPTVSFP